MFTPTQGFNDRHLTIACGKCLGCLLDRSRDWAIRCNNEISLHENNCFITLTYADDHLPPNGLEKDVFQRFIKRLRYRYDPIRFKYFGVGEYGSNFGRPHYHAILFGLDFPDKSYWACRKGHKTYRSETLESLWPFGNSDIGEANFKTAAYVARYLTKDYRKGIGQKHVREWRKEVGIAPEFCVMSRGGRQKGSHGIGYKWYEQYQDEVVRFDNIQANGTQLPIPRYYDKLTEQRYPELYAHIKRNRRGRPDTPDKTTRQLYAEQKIAQSKLETFKTGEL